MKPIRLTKENIEKLDQSEFTPDLLFEVETEDGKTRVVRLGDMYMKKEDAKNLKAKIDKFRNQFKSP